MSADSPHGSKHPSDAAAFVRALEQRDMDALEQILAKGNGLREVLDAHGYQAMVLAIRAGRNEVVTQLLQNGMNPNTTGPHGDVALMEAAVYGEAEAGQLLLQAGANLEARDPRMGTTAFLEAARCGQAPFLRMLAGAGADPHVQDRDGANARTLALLNDHQTAASVLRELGVQDQPEFAEDIAQTQEAVRAAAREMEQERQQAKVGSSS